MTIREEISKALVDLGVDITAKTVEIKADCNIAIIYVDDEYFGIWDRYRKTFVD